MIQLDYSPPSLDTAKAIMLGAAIGDMLGAPTEFKRWPAIIAAYGPEGLREPQADPYGLGSYTDDTQMAIAVARGILRTRTPYQVDAVAVEIAREFGRWYLLQHEPGQSRAPGVTCMSSCRELAFMPRPRSESVYDRELEEVLAASPHPAVGDGRSKGCGATMRVHPVAIAYGSEPRLVEAVAQRQAAITHNHPTASTAAGIFARVIAGAAATRNPAQTWTAAMRLSLGTELEPLLRATRWGQKSLRESLNDMGEGWTADEAAAIAISAACSITMASPVDLVAAGREAILAAANIDGDSDSVASMTGALVGALVPESILEWDRMLNVLEGAHELEALAFGLWRVDETLNASQE